ncbi:hypothetical protein GGR06_002126 [Bacteroides reticulotermitis]|uniref:DUF3575 domain-containing protein n=1 Tax=Bacteroides reticulotermitis TaxID=1133319 RepID=A0A840D7D7_9BACE|nr:DUF3575 domain-containing protein [Bacteroides reticulotermitis]MBB4044332.1 hypothetical protein [Bacteroides reticulotermitis]HJD76321.1 DUF3575 domain-containing protein [Bacteroides reticulotermitis]
MNRRLQKLTFLLPCLVLPWLYSAATTAQELAKDTPEKVNSTGTITKDSGYLETDSIQTLNLLYKQLKPRSSIRLSRFAVKSNLLHDLTGSLNLGVEMRTGDQFTLDMSVTYNPWKYGDMKKFNVIAVQPEIRYWSLEPFNKHFFGLHATYANFNIAGIGFSNFMKEHLLRGNLYEVGISYGYHWYLSPRWAMEASMGIGYVHVSYDQSFCKGCVKFENRQHKNYFTPSKASVSLIYMIK